MKKSKFFTAAALAVCLTALSACGSSSPDTDSNAVNLLAITGPEAVGAVDADYFLLAEPAVTAQSKKGYSIAGDIQALYGGENGYPQAVIVAKKSLVGHAFVGSFVERVQNAAEWLKTASATDIVNSVSAHMDDEGAATSLKAPMLSADVISRCGVRFSYAAESKDETIGFLREMLEVNGSATAIPQDEFFWDGECAESGDLGEITVCMPDGAPALALAQLMHEDTADDGITYKVVNSSLIASKVTYNDMDKNADVCVLPVTAASKLLGSGEKYEMLGVVTHGNLYLISKDGEQVTAENIEDLKGKTVGVLQINQVPGLTLKTVLKKYGVGYKEITNL